MATAKKDETTEAPKDEAEEARIKRGELTGKVRGQDVDSSFHVYEFTDPKTGEPVETPQVVHDVAVGVNADGSLKTEKATESFAKPAEGADTKQSQGANQGEAGETKTGTSS